MVRPAAAAGLTGAQGGGRDLDLAGGLVGLEGRGAAAGAEVGREQVGALGPRGAGAGAVAAVVRILFIVHGDQLEEGGKEEREMKCMRRKVEQLKRRCT